MGADKNLQTVKPQKHFLAYGEVYLTIQINAFLYYLGILPILGKIVHSSWYSRYRFKKVWSLFSLAFGFIKSALANNVGTLIIVYVIPHLFLKDEEVTEGVFLVLFVLLKCIGGALIECGLFKSSAEDYTFLNHFMVNPVSYYRYKGAKNAFFSSVMLFLAVYFLFREWGMTVLLVLFKLFCILGGNVLYLSFYKKYGRLPGKRMRGMLALSLIVFTYAGAFFGLYRNVAVAPIWQLAVGISCMLFSLISWNYHMHYSDYKKIAVKFANQSAISFQITVQSNSMGEEENGLLESGWEENREFFNAHREEPPERYLEQAFLCRFGKALRKERRDKVLILFFVGMVLGFGIRFGWLPVTSDTVLDYSPVLIAFSTSMTFAGHLMQMYFRNIDLHMLYHHMVTPEFIRRSMLRRYFYLMRGTLVSTAAIGANILLMLFLSELQMPLATVMELVAVCVVFLIFWETYECIVYYVVQPYSVDLTAKSPVFKMLGYLESIFYLLVLFVRRDLTAALPWVCAVGAGAVAVFFFCRRLAPKTFRLR